LGIFQVRKRQTARVAECAWGYYAMSLFSTDQQGWAANSPKASLGEPLCQECQSLGHPLPLEQRSNTLKISKYFRYIFIDLLLL